MESVKRINLVLPGDLVDEVDLVVEHYGVARLEFFVDAIRNELVRLSERKIREDIAMIEINESILAEGVSVNIVADEGSTEARYIECEMCHDSLPAPKPDVKGPFFCERCMGIANGADLSGLAP